MIIVNQEKIFSMKKTLELKRLFLFITAIIFLFSFSNPFFRPENKNRLLSKSDSLSAKYPQEKIYLHLDRPSYWAGDDIWFKAYLKNTAIPNCNLYVELLDSAGNVIYKDICWAMEGFAYGDFHLADTISSGMYQIRAYTSWLRNFDEQWFFRRDLVIWNLRDKQRAPDYQNIRARDVKIDFMPEGGTFLAGIKNRVAFKITDDNGKGLDAEGIVIDDDRNHVAEIKTGFKGMGSFDIVPKPGRQYTAEITVAGNIPKTIKLPLAAEEEVAMRYNPDNTASIHIEISEQNHKGNSNSIYFLVGQSEGQTCYSEEVKVTNGKAVLEIDKEEFPTGIVRFTLFNNEMIPRCERLVFVNNHDQVNVTVTPDKTEYKPREKITLDLTALVEEKIPVISNLSLSAYHIETTGELKTYPENIMTSFLLSSELKGKIEEPAYYFKDDSISTITALDNVMLTHGYRYFSWEEISNNIQPKFTFEPDSSIELKGQVVSLLFQRPVSGGKVTMMTLKSLLSVKEQTTDEEGNFTFSNLYFYDSLHVSLQALNHNGNKNTDIIWDNKTQESPKTSILPVVYLYHKESPSQTVTYFSEISPELLNRKWRLSDTILLQELNVVAKKRDEYGYVRPYVGAEIVIDVKKMKDPRREFDQLFYSSAAVRKMFEVDELNPYKYRPKGDVYINGVPDIVGFPPPPLEFIDKIEYIEKYPRPGGYPGPAIFFWTIKGKLNLGLNVEPAGMFPVELKGYTLTRNFYSPVYDGSENQEEKKEDYRSTLYWTPVIETNLNGEAQVSFYNSDQAGEVKIVVEGVTIDGELCRGTASYNVSH